MKSPGKRILIIYDDRKNEMVLTDRQHLRALEQSPTPHEIVYLNFADLAPSGDLGDSVAEPPASILDIRFDVVILHYLFLAIRTTGELFYKWKQASDWIRKLNCQKIAIPQDEMDHAGLLDDWLFEWEVDTIFSVHYKPDGPLYPRARARAAIINCLPGYINEDSAKLYAPQLKKYNQRPLDIAYRANNLPYWYGSHAQLKHKIAVEVQKRAETHKLRVDISTSINDVIEGDKWLDFLASTRCAIGGEGGRTALDIGGELRARVAALLLDNPQATFEQISKHMPPGWDDYHFLTITPRHLEAVITKTCQILIQGDYRGILEAGKHYIPIKPDFSDLDRALGLVHRQEFCESIAERAYEDIYLSGKYSYRAFADLIETAFYKSSDKQGVDKKMKPHSNQMDTAEEILERELVSIRHRNILLQNQLRMVEAQLQNARVELASFHKAQFEKNQKLFIRIKHWAFAHLGILMFCGFLGNFLLLAIVIALFLMVNR